MIGIPTDNILPFPFQHKTDERLQELLADNDYPGAIQVLLECQTVVATYRHFNAVKQLSSKLQDTLEMMEERLDVALAKVIGKR